MIKSGLNDWTTAPVILLGQAMLSGPYSQDNKPPREVGQISVSEVGHFYIAANTLGGKGLHKYNTKEEVDPMSLKKIMVPLLSLLMITLFVPFAYCDDYRAPNLFPYLGRYDDSIIDYSAAIKINELYPPSPSFNEVWQASMDVTQLIKEML